jgi:hypothetical protein
MTAELDTAYLDQWWAEKFKQNYGVQRKHLAAVALLESKCFPLVDLGAGAGIFLRLLEERFPGAKIEGREISETAIANKVCQADISRADIMRWVPPRRVAAVSLIDVVEHIADPEPLLRHVAGYADYVVLTCPNFNFVQARIDVMLGRIPFSNRIGRGGHVYWCQLETLRTFFRRVGLVVKAENHLFPRPQSRALARVFSRWPALFAHEFAFLLASESASGR